MADNQLPKIPIEEEMDKLIANCEDCVCEATFGVETHCGGHGFPKRIFIPIRSLIDEYKRLIVENEELKKAKSKR